MSLAEDIRGAGPRFDSAEAFLAWAERQPDRYELVDGVARMMTGGSRNHARISRNALIALSARLGTGACEAFGGDLAVLLGPLRVAYPDASVRCEPESEKGLVNPVVVIEVLSPTTEAYDRGDKASAYRWMASLRHLVLVRETASVWSTTTARPTARISHSPKSTGSTGFWGWPRYASMFRSRSSMRG